MSSARFLHEWRAAVFLDLGRRRRAYRAGSPPGGSLVISLLILAALLLPVDAFAQVVVPRLDPSGRSGEKRPDILEERLPQQLPTVPLPPPPRPPKEIPEPFLKSVFIKKIVVEGSTVFTPAEISTVTASYENRQMTSEDVEALRRELTVLYIKKGYVTSGAIIPDQTVVDGVITYRIIEGKLTQIDVEGNKWFTDSFLKERVALGAGPPVNVHPLQDRLQLLQIDQRLRSVHAELKPGDRQGEASLVVSVEENLPYSMWVAVNNYQSPSIGAVRGLANLAHQNLTGHGDILSATYGRSQGLRPQFDVWYVTPINAYDTTLLLRYRKNDSDNVDETFKPLDIVNKSEIFEVTLRHPVYRTLHQEFALALTLEHEYNKSYLLGEPFSFYPGVEDGEYTVVPLRFTQEWTYRTQRQVLAARSRFSFGLDAWSATDSHSSTMPGGQFVAWLGQFQWARITDWWDTQVLFRTDVQLTDDPLLPIEQISVGGRYSVRGYRENLLVRDQAFITSLELRIPIIRDKKWADYIQICPFFDYGKAMYKDLPTPQPQDIYSVGVGLRWSAPIIKAPVELRADFEFYWGYPLKHVDTADYNIQDSGIHFQFAITGF
jgi:hemolysin activation/secretion protein